MQTVELIASDTRSEPGPGLGSVLTVSGVVGAFRSSLSGLPPTCMTSVGDPTCSTRPFSGLWRAAGLARAPGVPLWAPQWLFGDCPGGGWRAPCLVVGGLPRTSRMARPALGVAAAADACASAALARLLGRCRNDPRSGAPPPS